MKKLKTIGSVAVKLLFFIICIAVSLVCAAVSAYFTITFYQYGVDQDENYLFWLLLALLAACIEIIKYVMALFYPLLIGRDLRQEKLINSMLALSLFMSILASLTFFLISHSEFQPVNRIVDMFYDTFLSKINFDYGRGSVSFIGNCIFSVIIEYFILLLPKVSTLPFRPKIENYKEQEYEKSSIGKIVEIVSVIPIYMIDRLHTKVMKKYSLVTLETQKLRQLNESNKSKKLLKPEDKIEVRVEEIESLSNDTKMIGAAEETNSIKNNIMDLNKRRIKNVNYKLKDLEKNKMNFNNNYGKLISRDEYSNYDQQDDFINDEYSQQVKNEQIINNQDDIDFHNEEIDEFQNDDNEKEKIIDVVFENDHPRENKIINIDEKLVIDKDEDEAKIKINKKMGEKLPFNIENVKLYFDFMQSNAKDDIAIGYKRVADNIGITQGEALRIFTQFRDKGYLRTENKKTKIMKKKLNIFDFMDK